MVFVIGFLIAVAVGLTGIGGGSFTVPCLVLLLGLAPKTAVGTAFIFAGVLRLIVGPFYLWGKQVRGAYVWRLLLGAVPGLLIGTYVLRLLSADLGNPVIVIVLGVLLAASSSLTFVRRLHKPEFARKNGHWLPWFALPIGIESGFFVCRRRSAGHSFATELFRDDSVRSCRHRHTLRFGSRRHRKRNSSQAWLRQLSHAVSTAGRRHPRRAAGIRSRAAHTCSQTEIGDCTDRHSCWTAVGMDWRAIPSDSVSRSTRGLAAGGRPCEPARCHAANHSA